MDIDQIEKLVELMKDSDLSSMEIEEETFRIRLAREKEIIAVHGGGGASAPAPLPSPATSAPAAAGGASAPEPEEKGIVYVKSPMVGTFYRAPSPDSPPFAEEGGKVKADSVVCIIEAMKVMNEIQSEVSGKIVEILVENGEPVEFGQALMKVKEG
ncbi:acetyl-CoA carboxylase biotin carboxyl carrier protein [Puniceicoccus vermicola]|uniref:Biotin carboxyl carrier protein of acetyl-CoA carboxylase n=1 Tax=Puniceicoccus vermicola TaxID=388746 RepID=A0A7X1AVS0_9BACT|nr:acetyl-CoA carboxylase biotin carboxyl carrier protein [Puniceicoccus vermicola]MBC2600654.1 acetyl-CoA carboxylase biotin carboxyl carrier protein [Puniceicoccus vermicola]